MNAETKIDSASKRRQSLEAKCRDCRWKLQQSFARLELAMAARLAPSAPATFGGKMRAIQKLSSDLKSFDPLIDCRNLVAHALVEMVELDGKCWSLWRVADTSRELDSRLMDEGALSRWLKKTEGLANDLLAKLEEANKS